MVSSSHCHFDHIGGMEAFDRSGAKIVASSFNKSFIAPENLAADSLTEAFGTVTPNYTYDAFADQNEWLQYEGLDLGLQALHTPGHTPDSMAVYDEGERWLYSGDTLYKRLVRMPWGDIWDVPIILPLQGDWKDYVTSIKELLAFVNKKDQGATPEKRVRLSAGHSTSGVLAGETIQSGLDFITRVERGEVPVIAKLAGDEVAPGGTLGKDR
jgi:glyoxylase-like metal-dependent hydrolase (beta-lactamase superfamily II)